jgi:hypothetical protein
MESLPGGEALPKTFGGEKNTRFGAAALERKNPGGKFKVMLPKGAIGPPLEVVNDTIMPTSAPVTRGPITCMTGGETNPPMVPEKRGRLDAGSDDVDIFTSPPA